PIGTTPVNCTASDSCSQSTNCMFSVTVTNVPIVLTCPTNIVRAATGPNGATVFYSTGVSGGCTTPSVICNPPSGSTFPIGTTPVNCSATDSCTNSAACMFSVTVTNSPPQTNSPPTFTSVARGSNGVRLTFNVPLGTNYIVQFVNSLANVWSNLASPQMATTNPNTFLDPFPLPAARFYRIFIPGAGTNN